MNNLWESVQDIFCSSAQRRENRLRQVANSVQDSPNAALITDRRGNIQYSNTAFSTLTGFSPAEAIGMNAQQLLAEAISAGTTAQVIEAFRAGKSWKGEILIARKNGERYWQETLLLPIFRKNEVEFFLATGEDLSERRASQTSLQRRLEELALINTLSLAAASQLELDALVTLAGENLERAFQVRSVFIALYDAEKQLISAPYWTIDKQRVQAEPMRYGEGLTSTVLKNRAPLLIEHDFENVAPQLGAKLTFAKTNGLPKTWLGVPILAGEEALGVISLQDYQREAAFSQEDIRLLTTIAANLGIAIRNAHLFRAAQEEIARRKQNEDQLRRQSSQLALFYEISKELSSNLELEQVLRNLLGKCRQLLPLDVFYVAIYDAETQIIHHPLFFDKNTLKNVPARDLHAAPGLSGEIVFSRKTVYLPDTQQPEVARQYQIIHSGGESSRSYVGVPMLAHGQVIGVISMQSYQPNRYTPEHIQMLEAIASQAAIAIENSQLYEKTRAEAQERRLAQENLQETNQALQSQIHSIEAIKDELRKQAIRDPLTGLYNRRYLDEIFDKKLQHARRKGAPLSVVMFDIDHFKQFNDAYGHPVGDRLLRKLGELLRGHIRHSDIACRYGGEEFLLLLPDTPLEAATRRAEEIRRDFAEMTLTVDGKTVSASISLGLVTFPEHAQTPEGLIIQADQAMYSAKQAGRNCVFVWRM
ncbi:MAG: hypothetical protein OHK0031_09290 [Anaerolineales bacterium]